MTETARTPTQPKSKRSAKPLAILNKLTSVAEYKDAVTTWLAIVVAIVGAYQYFDVRSDQRIKAASEILARRESTQFVDARAALVMFVYSNQKLVKSFSEAGATYTPKLLDDFAEIVRRNEAYQKAVTTISPYYINAAACAMDGICDIPTMCASLWGEIQDYLDVNRAYFAYLMSIRGEDAVSLWLGMANFEQLCRSKLKLFVFSRFDNSLKCRLFVALYRRFDFAFDSACTHVISEYDDQLFYKAAKITQRATTSAKRDPSGK